MRPFTDVLGELAGGRTLASLNDSLAALALEVGRTGKKGSLAIKLTVSPNGENCVVLNDTITLKLPEAVRGGTIFFADDHGSLVREDPRQERLPLREVALNRGELKEVG